MEVSTHSIRQQDESQKEEFITMKEGLEGLTNVVPKMNVALEAKGIRIDETNNNSGRDNVFVSPNHKTKESSKELSRGTQYNSLQTRFSRLDFPCFDGENPIRWIYKVKLFFHYQRTKTNDKVLLASFYLQDEALEWYQWYE